MPACGLDGPWRDHAGFAQTMECVAGMAWLTGFPDGPPVLVRGACDPLAGMHAVFATILALRERARTGEGMLVESTMVEAALNAAVEGIFEHDITGEVLGREGNRSAVAAAEGLYRCDGEERWAALAVADDAQWSALRAVLGDPAWAADAALGDAAGRRAAHDAVDAELGRWFAGRDAAGVVEALAGAGVPAEVVIPASEIAHNPQLRHPGLFGVEDHAATGRHALP